MSQADEGAVRIPKDRPSYFDISKVPIDAQMSNAFNRNMCFIQRRLVSPQQDLKVGTLARLARPTSLSFRSPPLLWPPNFSPNVYLRLSHISYGSATSINTEKWGIFV